MSTRLTPDEEAPSEIWLQWPDPEESRDSEQITWADSEVGDYDVKYVRASKVRELEAQVASLGKAVTDIRNRAEEAHRVMDGSPLHLFSGTIHYIADAALREQS